VSTPVSPPKLFLRFFRWFCHPKLLKYIEGDLMELYEERKVKIGKGKADLKFIIDVLLLFRPSNIRPTEGYQNLNNYDMFKNYFKIGWRNILRHKVYTTINVLGLTLGLCACIVVYVIVSYEFGFDSFHADKDRIYRVIGDVTESTGDVLHFSRVPVPIVQTSRREVSGLEVIAGSIPYNAKITIPERDRPSKQFSSIIDGTRYLTTIIVEPQYFDIFEYEWLAGDFSSALSNPSTVVLTEARARQYFGSMPLEEILGKQIIYEDSLNVSVSGIVKGWSQNTDLPYTDFISFSTLQNQFLKKAIHSDSWGRGDMYANVFLKLAPGTTPQQVNSQLASLMKTHGEPETKLGLWLEPLSAIHYDANIIENPIRTAHLPTLYGLAGIALFILLLAIINFINLSTAQSIQRAKEVGVRKALGSNRSSLVFQFLTETFL